MHRFGHVSLPFLGLVTVARWSTNQGLGLDFDRKTGTTVWLGRWEVNSDHWTLPVLPFLVPLAILMAFKPRFIGGRARSRKAA